MSLTLYLLLKENMTIKHVSLVLQQATGADQADKEEDKAEEEAAE